MDVKEILVIPFFLLLFYGIAFLVRPWVTDQTNRKYFIPALSLKFLGALSLGFVYEFYYGYGGDTFNYYYHPGSIVASSFFDSPITWIQLLFSDGSYDPATYQYASRIFTFQDGPTFFIGKIVGYFGVFTFNSYYGIALCFAALSFSGVWALYVSFYQLYPSLAGPLAVSCLYLPSLWFWGSGILKDSITFAAFGWLIFGLISLFLYKRFSLINLLIITLSSYVLFTVKIYILLCLIPSIFYWVTFTYLARIRNRIVKVLVLPAFLVFAAVGGYWTLNTIGQNNSRYSLQAVSDTAASTAQWLSYVGEKEGGSVYTLGDFDYSPTGTLQKAPLAVWTSLYRPHLWEASNAVMLMAALESLLLLVLTIRTFYKVGIANFFLTLTRRPLIGFLMIFSVTFALAIGIATYNFGSLVRYRIPLIPLFLIGLVLIEHYHRKKRLSLKFNRN